MNRQPVWLRREGAYRAYVRGLRYFLVGFLLAGLAVLGAASGIVPAPVLAGMMIVAFLICIPSLVSGMIGWIMVPDKNRANLHQYALLAMIGHDIFKGLPRD